MRRRFLKENRSNLIIFTIDGVQYQAEEGMTWEEWCDSKYNIDGYRIFNGSNKYVVDSSEIFYVMHNHYQGAINFCTGNEIIIADKNYVLDLY